MAAWIGLIGVLAGGLITFGGTFVAGVVEDRRGRERRRREALQSALAEAVDALIGYSRWGQNPPSEQRGDESRVFLSAVSRLGLLLTTSESSVENVFLDAYFAISEPDTRVSSVLTMVAHQVPRWFRGEIDGIELGASVTSAMPERVQEQLRRALDS